MWSHAAPIPARCRCVAELRNGHVRASPRAGVPMSRTRKVFSTFYILAAISLAIPARGDDGPATQAFKTAIIGTRVQAAALWRDRGNTEALNLLYGAGGKDHQPAGRFTFVKEDKQGTAAKFEVVDEQGIYWKAKL